MVSFIYSYNFHSKGARELAKAAGLRRIKHHNSHFIGRPNKMVVNWGSTSVSQQVNRCHILNSPTRVEFCTNKLKFFQVGSRHARLPDFATSIDEAKKLLKKGPIVARTYLSASGGRGAVYTETEDALVSAPLYTKYIKKMSEFRVHIFKGEVIDVQRKAKRKSVPESEVNWAIRNLAGGFVYVRHDMSCPKDVTDQACAAFNWTGLDFGAVDVVWNQKKRQAYVLEINTAPGLEGSTVQSYAEALKEMLDV